MTEVPEHLLRRARERRAALAGGEGAAAAPAAPEAPATAESSEAPPAAAAAAPATTAATAPAVVAETPEASAAAAAASAAYVREQAVRRTRVPMFVAPVLLVLPFWAFLYAGAFGDRDATHEVDPLQLGADIYRSAGCSSCHGAGGEGGVGPALAGDEVEQTFPDAEGHMEWIRTGSIGTPSAPEAYGDPNRPGGQRLSRGGMPTFGGRLSEEEIAAVVQYEREQL